MGCTAASTGAHTSARSATPSPPRWPTTPVTTAWPMPRWATGCCARRTPVPPGTADETKVPGTFVSLSLTDCGDQPLGHPHRPHRGPLNAGVAGEAGGAQLVSAEQFVREREGGAR